MRRYVSSGGSWEGVAGYSRAVVDGEWIFVSGTAGFHLPDGEISDDAAEQARQALRNVSWALGQAGASLADVVRVVAYVTDRKSFETAAPVFGEVFGDIRPANTTVLCELVDPRMKIEVEVTARRAR